MVCPLRTIVLSGMLALSALAAGCSTPTLPLPPPAALSATPPDATGTVTVEGDVLEDAYVFCLNDNTARGVIVRADEAGHFVLQIAAESGHELEIWQEISTDTGEHVFLSVPGP